jgi:hypothetical protein
METKRYLLFLLGCIGTRLLLTWFSYFLNFNLILPIITGLISIGFITIYLTGIRKTGAEVFGEKIWWNSLRPIHGLLYLLFTLLYLKGYNNAWIILLVDTLIGLTAFLYHRLK